MTFRSDEYTPIKGNLKVSIYNVLILFYNFLKAKKDKDIGYMELNQTEEEFMKKAGQMISVDIKTLQSLLYYSNLLDEKKKFWHPDKKSFDGTLTSILRRQYDFDKKFNLLSVRGRIIKKK